MQRASHKMQDTLNGKGASSVQEEQQQLEKYLMEPECDRAIQELIQERKLDFMLMDLTPDVIASKLADLLNAHCIAYLISKKYDFMEDVRKTFYPLVYDIVVQVANSIPDLDKLFKVLKLGPGPLRERLKTALPDMDWYEKVKLCDKAVERLARGKLVQCLADLERAVKPNTNIESINRLKLTPALKECLKWGKISDQVTI
jgi:hypothetical protein